MNVLFIVSETLKKKLGGTNKEKPLKNQEEIHYGVSYISSLLKKHGHNIEVFVKTSYTKDSEIDNVINTFNPKLIGFSAVFREFESIAETAKYIKEKFPSLYLVAGGAHITLSPEESIRENFDAICIGEGEYATLELVEQLEKNETPSNIKNLWIKTKDGIEKNPTRPFLENLDELPYPDRGMWQKLIKDPNTLHNVIIGRGCPFNCTYCCNHALREVAEGKYVRFRSSQNIIGEIKEILEQFPDTDTIFLEAEALNLYPSFLFEFCDELEAFNKTLKKPISYGANIRLNPASDMNKIMFAFTKANIVIVNIGLESGSERVRKEILKRGEYSNKDVLQAVKIAKRYHRHTMLFVLLGIPGETYEDFLETLEITKKCRPHFIHLGIFTPYPGTELYDYSKEHNLLSQSSYKEKGRSIALLDLPGFTRKQIQKEYFNFFPNVYARSKSQLIKLKILSRLILKYNFTFLFKKAMKYMK